MAGPVAVVLGGKWVAAGKQEFVFEDWCSLSLSLSLTHTHTHTHTHTETGLQREHDNTSIPQRETLPPGHPPEGINTNTQVWNNEGGNSLGDQQTTPHMFT